MKTTAILGAVLLGAGLTATSPAGAAESFKMAGLGAASTPTVFSIAVGEIIKREHDYRVQLQTGSPATRQAVAAAKGELDFFVTAVSINHYMKNGLRMFEKMGNSRELFDQLRGVINYPLGAYQTIVWADSGIEQMKDIKGKKVFIGPPTGAARATAGLIVSGVTGYQPKQDYETANYDWNSAAQAFQDKQIDVYILPTSIPSPQVAQIDVLGKFRILGVPEEAMNSEDIKKATAIPGRSFVTLKKGTYPNLVNETDVQVLNSMVGLGTTKDMSEEVVYNVTKAIFENQKDLIAAAKWMEVITPQNALSQMNMPLHIGAYKYFREIGIEVPEEIVPPEAK